RLRWWDDSTHKYQRREHRLRLQGRLRCQRRLRRDSSRPHRRRGRLRSCFASSVVNNASRLTNVERGYGSLLKHAKLRNIPPISKTGDQRASAIEKQDIRGEADRAPSATTTHCWADLPRNRLHRRTLSGPHHSA